MCAGREYFLGVSGGICHLGLAGRLSCSIINDPLSGYLHIGPVMQLCGTFLLSLIFSLTCYSLYSSCESLIIEGLKLSSPLSYAHIKEV
jgi:hypothetical protein